MPKRVKVIGDLFHGRIPEGAVYVGRAQPGLKQSPFANPWCVVLDRGAYMVRHHRNRNRIAGSFSDRDAALRAAVNMYRSHLDERPDLRQAAVEQLPGKDLCCWCAEPASGQPDICHAIVLLELANARFGECHESDV